MANRLETVGFRRRVVSDECCVQGTLDVLSELVILLSKERRPILLVN
jgi:hypothetical protein